MQTIIVIAVLVLLYFVFRSSNDSSDDKPKGGIPEDLVDHWITVKQWKSESSSPLPRWYFDEPTERQLERLKSEGMKPPKGAKKGHVSDLIGLTESPDEGDKEILKFFKEPYGGLTLTGANIKIREIFSNPENQARWDNRFEEMPASQVQKEGLKMLGIKAPKGLTHADADKLFTDADLTESQEEEWHAFSDIWDELCDPEIREENDIKKPSMTRYKQALKAIDEDREAGDADDDWRDGDSGPVFEKLIDLFPELER